MKIALAIAALVWLAWSLPVAACPFATPALQVYAERVDGAAEIAVVVHDNCQTIGFEGEISLDVEGYGTIVVHLVTTTNPDPDTVTVIDVPNGLAIIPLEATTEEGSRSVLRVYRTGA